MLKSKLKHYKFYKTKKTEKRIKSYIFVGQYESVKDKVKVKIIHLSLINAQTSNNKININSENMQIYVSKNKK